MYLKRLSLVLSPWILLNYYIWMEPIQASFLSSVIGSAATDEHMCGPAYPPCPESAPCCHRMMCHKTSTRSCSLALGCEPRYSFQLPESSKPKSSKEQKTMPTNQDDKSLESQIDHPQSCFPLPVCRSFKESFKNNKNLPDKHGLHQTLVPKINFTGDPNQAHWTSDFDHIVPYATIDPTHKRLVLKARRDAVRTPSGGGFGATVSSTRWNRYGTFSAKFKSGATGPGIVTAMTLSNPFLGEEITIEITGKNPRKVYTDLYRHAPHESKPTTWLPSFLSGVHIPSVEEFKIQTRRLKELIMRKRRQSKELTTDTVVVQRADDDENSPHKDSEKDFLEESHDLKKSATENELVYKIEWTPDRIQWSVDKQVLRTLTAKDLLKYEGYQIPSYPMQLQLTIWDGGYDPETSNWAGGETNYGDMGNREYATLVEWVDISCYDPKESKHNPWPGTDGLKRLEQVRVEEREREKEKLKSEKAKLKIKDQRDINESSTKRKWIFSHDSKENSHSQQHHHHQHTLLSKDESSWITRLSDTIVRLLVRWSLILVVVVGSASYLTEPLNTQQSKHSRTPISDMSRS